MPVSLLLSGDPEWRGHRRGECVGGLPAGRDPEWKGQTGAPGRVCVCVWGGFRQGDQVPGMPHTRWSPRLPNPMPGGLLPRTPAGERGHPIGALCPGQKQRWLAALPRSAWHQANQQHHHFLHPPGSWGSMFSRRSGYLCDPQWPRSPASRPANSSRIPTPSVLVPSGRSTKWPGRGQPCPQHGIPGAHTEDGGTSCPLRLAWGCSVTQRWVSEPRRLMALHAKADMAVSRRLPGAA